MSLSRAVTALTSGDDELALTHLLVAWRLSPHPRIAELVQTVGHRISPDRITARNRREYHELWLRRASAGRPRDVGALMDGLGNERTGTVADLVERVGLVERGTRDPRWAAAVIDMLRSPPYRSTRAQSFYDTGFRVIERVADVRGLPALIDLTLGEPDEHGGETARIERSFTGEMGWWMRNRLEHCIRTLKEVRPPDLSDDQLEDIARISELLGLANEGPEGRERVLAELMQTVRQDPDNDHVRQVCADLLIERGDPRGMFIQLQYRRVDGTLTRDQERRERALLRNHWKTWVGSLLPVLDRNGFDFERGFLSRVVVLARNRREALEVVGAEEWATVREVELRPASEGWRPFEAILHPCLRSLHTLRYVATEAELQQLLEGDRDRDLRTLGVDAVSLAMWGSRGRFKRQHAALLGACRRLPKLERLEFACPYGPANFEPSVSTLGWIAHSEVAERLRCLYVGRGLRYLADWMMVTSDSPLDRIELDGTGWTAVLSRGRDGLMSDLYATPRGAGMGAPGELTRALERIPRGKLTRLTIDGDHPELPSVALIADRIAGGDRGR